jgi:hypothetical protein
LLNKNYLAVPTLERSTAAAERLENIISSTAAAPEELGALATTRLLEVPALARNTDPATPAASQQSSELQAGAFT